MKIRDFSYAQKRDSKKNKMPTVNILGYRLYVWAIPLLPILYPIFLTIKISNKIEVKLYNRRKWTDEKATKALDAILPHILEWVEEDNAYYFCSDWSINIFCHNSPRRYRKWVQKYKYRLAAYLISSYQKAGYIKTIEKDSFDTWVKFVKEG